jgi:predicted acetyltransferase
MQIVRPGEQHLPSYIAALEQGWSSDTVRGAVAAREDLQEIAADRERFLSLMDDREAKGGPVTLPDGSTVPRLPGYTRWLWDGEFCGEINFRWQPGTTELPPHCLGHIGYGVVPWKRNKGYAKQALNQFLQEVRDEGLPFIEITTDTTNVASQRAIVANGGVLVEEFIKPMQHGGKPGLRFRSFFNDRRPL